MSKRIGLSPTATVERLLKGKPTWFVTSRGVVLDYAPGWYESTMEFSTHRNMIQSIKAEQLMGYRDFATLEEAERYAERLRSKGTKP